MSETLMQQEPQAMPAEAHPALGASGLVLLCLSTAASAWYLFSHDPLVCMHLPGIGLTITQWALMAAALICARKKLTVRRNWQGMLLLILAALLGGSYGLFANDTLRLLNLPVTVFLSCQAVFSLTGQQENAPLSAQGLWEGFRRFFDSLFRHWNVPFQALAQRKQSNGDRSYTVLIGLVLAVPAVAVATALLSSADRVFGGAVLDRLQRLSSLDASFFLKLLFLFPLSMTLFSHLFGVLAPNRQVAPARGGRPPSTVFAVVLLALSAVYALFGYVQVRYLFGGAESVRMAGGYAEYARSGFFQLVLLSVLTLALILPALTLCGNSRAIRALCAALAALTLLIDASAFFRMRLYIGAYGLSLLRVLTVWAMAMIALTLIAVMIQCVFSALRICPFLAAAALITWVGLNFANVDRIVAGSQVSRINAGTAGPEAIASLPWSPDYLPALQRIADQQLRDKALRFIADPDGGAALCRPGLCEWSISYLQLPPDEKH